MKSRLVRDLMIPVSEYEIIDEKTDLLNAAISLRKAVQNYLKKGLLYDCILVSDNKGRIVGKISPVDIIKALEPKYSRTGDSDTFSKVGVPHFGLSPEYIKSIVSRYSLWNETLENMLKNASDLRAVDFMYKSEKTGHLMENSTVADAIHQMALSHHSSVLVFNNNEITGIISLKDIFKEVCSYIDKS